MSKSQHRIIYRTDNGWANKRSDAARPTSLHNTQREAYNAAKEILIRQGGGEIPIKGSFGRIRERSTIVPGSEPRIVLG